MCARFRSIRAHPGSPRSIPGARFLIDAAFVRGVLGAAFVDQGLGGRLIIGPYDNLVLCCWLGYPLNGSRGFPLFPSGDTLTRKAVCPTIHCPADSPRSLH